MMRAGEFRNATARLEMALRKGGCLIVLAALAIAGPALAQPWEPHGQSWRYSGPDGAYGWGYRQGGVTYETHYPPKGPAVHCETYRTNGGDYTHCN